MLDIKRKKELSNLSYAGLAQKIQWGKNQWTPSNDLLEL
jgi:hypothetical protein